MRAKENFIKEDKQKIRKDLSIEKAKIFPFYSVYNLLLLAQMKVKHKNQMRKQMNQKLKSAKQSNEKSTMETTAIE